MWNRPGKTHQLLCQHYEALRNTRKMQAITACKPYSFLHRSICHIFLRRIKKEMKQGQLCLLTQAARRQGLQEQKGPVCGNRRGEVLSNRWSTDQQRWFLIPRSIFVAGTMTAFLVWLALGADFMWQGLYFSSLSHGVGLYIRIYKNHKKRANVDNVIEVEREDESEAEFSVLDSYLWTKPSEKLCWFELGFEFVQGIGGTREQLLLVIVT